VTNNGRAEEIADKVRDLEEHLNAWKSLATRNCSNLELARLERLVEEDITRVRSEDNYREHVAEFLKALHRANDDNSLLETLHAEIQYRVDF